MKSYVKYGLFADAEAEAKNDMNNMIKYKLFNKAEMLDEVEKLGFMSDWHPEQKVIEAYDGEEILVIWDPKQKYGDSWIWCTTEAAKAAQMAVYEAEEQAERDRLAAIAAEEARIAAEEEAARNAVFEDKPMYARPYVSGTTAETIEDLRALNVPLDRPLFGCAVQRPLHSFGHVCQFGDRDADNEKYLEFRAQKNPEFDMLCMLKDIGLQASSRSGQMATQTTWYRPVNKAVQYTPEPPRNDDGASKRLAQFLADKRPVLEEALQKNETVEIFGDAFVGVGDDEAASGAQEVNELKELRTFNDIMYSKNMSLAAVDWHPKRRRMIGVAPVRNLTFDARVDQSGKAVTAYILIWDFVDLIHPQLMLQSPHEILTFRFNKWNPNIVAAGCLNGQVLVWNIKDEMEKLTRRQHRSSTARSVTQNGAGGEEEEEDAKQPPILPISTSHIDSTHKKMVADLHWLAPNSQINFRGQILAEEHLSDTSHQFMTVAGDGQCLVWDTRFQAISEGQLPHVMKPRGGGEKPGKDGLPVEAPWRPLFRMQLKRLEGVGELSLCCSTVVFGDASDAPDGVDRRSQLFASSEEGEIVFADWRPPKPAAAAGKSGDDKDDDDGGNETPEYVQWMSPDHARPAVALQPSPFFNDLIVSVGDWNFQLWKLGHQAPIFTSPPATERLTHGCWSPTRPGMLFMARDDGLVDVWDLTDSSYIPSVQLLAAPTRITAMEFLPPANLAAKQQLLAVGDKVGNLHIFEVPRTLWRSATNEKSLMEAFVAREVSRVQYVSERMEIRREEAAANAADEEKAAEGGADGAPAAGDGPNADVELSKEELDALQAEYKEVESKLVEDLGLTEAELPAGYQLPAAK